jgi:hypothetical protein
MKKLFDLLLILVIISATAICLYSQEYLIQGTEKNGVFSKPDNKGGFVILFRKEGRKDMEIANMHKGKNVEWKVQYALDMGYGIKKKYIVRFQGTILKPNLKGALIKVNSGYIPNRKRSILGTEQKHYDAKIKSVVGTKVVIEYHAILTVLLNAK